MFSQFRQSILTKCRSAVGGVRKASTATSTEELGRYPTSMQFMHWATGGSLIACIGLVNYAQYLKGKEKMNIMFYHKSFGLLAAGLIAPRILVRLASKVPSPIPGSTLEMLAARVTHAALYGFMLFMPISGIAMGYYGGKGLPFFYTTVPGAEKADGAIAKQSFELHKLVGHYGQYLIPAHIGAVGFHLIAKGKNIMPRILSAGK